MSAWVWVSHVRLRQTGEGGRNQGAIYRSESEKTEKNYPPDCVCMRDSLSRSFDHSRALLPLHRNDAGEMMEGGRLLKRKREEDEEESWREM